MPMLREADVTEVLQDALRTGKTLALPLCGKAPCMTLRRVDSLEKLVPGAYGIPEPPADSEEISADRVNLLLVPLEAIDPNGMRLGKGGGYYDRLLAGKQVCTLGCALSWQQLAQVPRDPWDKQLDACADMTGIHFFDIRKD